MRYGKLQIIGLAMFLIPIAGGFTMLAHSIYTDIPQLILPAIGAVAYSLLAGYFISRG